MELEFVYEKGKKYPLVDYNPKLLKQIQYMVEGVLPDFSTILDMGKTGEVSLPYDATGEDFYFFHNIPTPVSVELHFTITKDVDFPVGDAEYYSEDNTIGIKLEIPEFYDYQDVSFVLTELLAHEMTHFIQDVAGYPLPGKFKGKKIDYYLQPHEIEAQFVGFAVASRKFNVGAKVLFWNWVKNSKSVEGVSSLDISILETNIFGEYGGRNLIF
jgi:hypothetical protein